MPATTPNPANLQHVPVLFTPLGGVLFYDRVNEAGSRSDARQVKREIGDAHPLSTRWPNHKLAGIGPDPDEGWTRYYYAADRATQHEYNWEYDGSSGLTPVVRQTYVVKRSDLTSLTETSRGRVYYLPDTISGVDCSTTASPGYLLAKAAHGLIPEDPVVFSVAGDTGAALNSVYFVAQGGWASGVFALSDEGGYGGALAALNSGAATATIRAAVSIRPQLPGNWYQSRCVIKQAPVELAGLYVVLEVIWEHYPSAVDEPVLSYELDELTGQVMPVYRRRIRTLAAASVAADVDSSGLYTVTEPIDAEHSWAVTRKASALAGVGAGRSYDDVVTGYTWPMVLGATGITYQAWELTVDGGTRMERLEFIVNPSKEPWSGASKVVVQERWATTAASITKPDQPMPRRVFWDTGFGVLNVGPCLHPAFTGAYYTTASDDVNYPSTTTTMASHYSAGTTLSDNSTACEDWPASFVLEDGQRPYRGGFLRRTVTIYKPY